MSSKLKIGIAGAGVFGSYHAAKYVNHAEADLVGVFDPDQKRAEDFARKFNASTYVDYADFLAAVDAVVIAAPASQHFQLAEAALHSGRHVFVEKPIALSVEAADTLIAIADEAGLVLQVGHQERYVCDAVGLLGRDKSPIKIDCIRYVPFSGRCDDVSVAFDLMVHDLDIIRQLTKSEIREISAEGDSDKIRAEFTLGNDALVSVRAGRRADRAERRMTLVYDDGVIDFDFANRTFTNTTPIEMGNAFESERAPLAMRDPLEHGAALFVNAINAGETPLVTGHDGRDAVAWACAIEDAAGLSSSAVLKQMRA